MDDDRDPWQDGRRAWERLAGWHQDGPPTHPDDGPAALAALDDVGLVRRLLDQAELAAVRTARRQGKSWAEIATRLGVTRQSAWERWRDLDESPNREGVPTPDAGRPDAGGPDDGAPAGAVARTLRSVSEDLVEQARGLRRRSTVVVPNVIGMSWDDARRALSDRGLLGVGPDLDRPPPTTAPGQPSWVVTDQSPESGARIPLGSTVTLWTEPGGGSGVREPRRPKPTPKTARALPYEPSDEAVG